MTTTTPQPSPRTSTPKCGLKMHRRGIIWLRLASITSAVYFMAMNCLTSLEVTTSSSAQKTSLFNIYHDTSHQQRRENYIRQAFPKERIKQNAVKVEDDDDELETDRVVLDSTRQNRTRPLLSLAPSSDAFQMTLLPGTIYNEALLIHVDRRQNLNVTMLCENAGLQSSSRVTIGGLLTQPPSQALVLFLAKHCGVKSILGIDPLFPNHASNRVKAMQDYQQLVHGIEELRLLVPLANFSNDDAIVNSIVDFNTTHLVSIMTFPPDHSKVLTDQGRASYDTQSGLRALQRLLLSVTQLKSNSADAVAPSFVHVTSLDSKDSIWAQSASVMLSAVRDVSVTHLQVPFLFGPLVAPELDSSKVPVEQQMFVDQAVVSILKAMEQTSHPTTMSSYRRMETFSTDNTITEHMEVYRSETRDWVNSLIKPQLGTATISTANYVDWYGLPRNIFPCASRCESKSCSATMFDSIQNITREATEGCRAVVYYGNFSVDFEDLGTHEGQVGASRLICRVIFVSKKSRLVATITRQVKMSQLQFASSNETNTSDESLLVMINGIRYGDWNIVWVDRDETTISELDLALMVIDPSAIFAKSVDRAMYTESLSMMRADVKHLLQILKKIALVAFPAQTIRQRIGSTKGIQSVAVSAQNSRRAIFYAEAAMEDYSLESYLHVTGSTAISDKQKTFYKQSTDIIMSTEGRTKAEIHSSPFTSFPFQWTSTAFHMHDTTMSHSQDFRCDWLKESLTWGGGRDVMSLSWAYTIGKYLAEGTIQPPPSTDTHPINTDRSWFPLVRNSGTNTRVMNRRADEIFVRILPEKTASGRTNLRWQDILISTV